MKVTLSSVAIGALLLCNVATAANYDTICNSCSPFSKTSSAVLTAAVNLGSGSGAGVGDLLSVCKDIGPDGHAAYISYDVTSAPVTSSSNISWNFNNSIVDLNCEGDPI
ncbi:MAG: hypothetical protein ABI411_00940 [Tahibacter sp.]